MRVFPAADVVSDPFVVDPDTSIGGTGAIAC